MNDSHENVEENYRNFILPYKHRIHSFYLDGSDISSKFFRAYTIDGSFTRLESIVISNISYENAIAAIFCMKSLPKLVSLTIDFACDVDKDGSIIFQSILQFLTLKYLNITAGLWAFDLKIPMTIDSKPSLVERMILNVGLRVSELVTIIQHTPKLKYLSCINIVESNDINLNDQPLLLTQLTYLSIKNFQADFDEFEYLIKEFRHKYEYYV